MAEPRQSTHGEQPEATAAHSSRSNARMHPRCAQRPRATMRAVTPLIRPGSDRAFDHKALFYEDDSGFLDGTIAFILEGLAAEQPTLVLVDGAKSATLRDALGSDAGAVQFADIRKVGANPAWLIPAWQRFIERHAGPRGLRGISEPIMPGRSPAELVECQIHESLLNLVFANSGPFAMLCPYQHPGARSASPRRSAPLPSPSHRRRTRGAQRPISQRRRPASLCRPVARRPRPVPTCRITTPRTSARCAPS